MLGAEIDALLDKAEIRGEGTFTRPPDAVARVRQELAQAADPERRRELEEVLRALIRGDC